MQPLRALAAGLASLLVLTSAPSAAAPGDLDATFGTGGLVSASFIVPTGPGLSGITTVIPLAVAAQADGKIVALASVRDSGTLQASYTGLARFNADGSPDTSFGSNGQVLLQRTGVVLAGNAMALLADGTIVVTGTSGTSSPPYSYGSFLAHLGTDGQLDGTFLGGGILVQPSVNYVSPQRILALQGGTLLVVGLQISYPSTQEVYTARYLADGTPDVAYGTAGVAIAGSNAPDTAITSAVRQPDGKVLVTTINTTSFATMDVLRLTVAGDLDITFNQSGRVNVPIGSGWASANDVLALPDGRIVLGGYARANPIQAPTGVNEPRFALVRLLASGALDESFGLGGVITPRVNVGGLTAMAAQSDGRIVGVGAANNSADVALLRFLPDGSLDPNIKGTGRAITDLGGNESASAVALQGDGAVVVAVGLYANVLRLLRYEGGSSTAVVGSSVSGTVLLGQPASFHANVFGLSPTGTVTFRSDGLDIAGCVNIPLVSASATCPSVVLAGGAHAITVAYSGDADDPGENSAPFTQNVLSPTTDVDNDGIPDFVETLVGTDPVNKDNDLFPLSAQGAKLFAMQQYRDFLAREGDTAGITGWTNALVNGTFTQEDVVDAFLASAEFSGNVAPVVRLYFATFLRIPDYAGLMFNAGLVKGGTLTRTQLANFFAASPEFIATYGALDDTQFVTLLYNNVLHRAPDAAGLAGWVGLMQGGYSRGQVLLGFSDSIEYQAAIANEVFVTMMYAGLLRRTPEAAGFNGWVALLDAGATHAFVIHGFIHSTEYRARFLP